MGIFYQKMKSVLNIAIITLLINCIEINAINLESYPYFTVSDGMAKAVKEKGGKAEFEPLGTATMKDLPNRHELTKNAFRDGLPEQAPFKDSIEERIKAMSRSNLPEEKIQQDNNTNREREIINYDNRRAWELGIRWNPKN